jgi:hypothetical protein
MDGEDDSDRASVVRRSLAAAVTTTIDRAARARTRYEIARPSSRVSWYQCPSSNTRAPMSSAVAIAAVAGVAAR